MGKSQSKKLKEFLRGQEYKRKQEIQAEKRLKAQQALVKDFVRCKSVIARKNELYPLTEKVLDGSPEALEQLLVNEDVKEFKPSDFPQGLVIGDDFYFTANLS